MRSLLKKLVVVLVVVWLFGRITNLVSGVFGPAAPVAWLVLLIGAVVAWRVSVRLREVRPWSWWPVFGAPVAVWWMLRTWSAACEELGLSVPAARSGRFGLINGPSGGLVVRGTPLKVIAPRRVGLRVRESGLEVRVRLAPGQTPAQFERAAEGLAHAWRIHRVRVEVPRPGLVTLVGLGFDPLRHPKPRHAQEIAAVGHDPVELPSSEEDGRERVEHGSEVMAPVRAEATPADLSVSVGIREDSHPWLLDLTRRPHYLVCGATRSGKSTLTVRMLAELARRPVGLVGIDAKNGMELSPFGPRLSALAVNRAEAAAAIDGLLGVLELRTMTCREHGARSIWDLPSSVRPWPIVVVVDEVAELMLAADKPGKEEAARCIQGLIRLGQLGAALGIHLWVSGQRFGSDLGPGATLLRAQLAGRVCHRVADAETAAMTLAGLPPEAVLEAQKIPADLAGVAVAGDDSGAWHLVRSDPMDITEAAALASQYAGLCLDLPEVEAAVHRVRLGGGW
jgi:S-DNA-T family DNA segregation ATPase FtsK/SpoIIIE